MHVYRGYVFTIQYWIDDPWYTVRYLDLLEIITGAATLPEAFANACEALDLHDDTLQQLGQVLPKPRHRLIVKRSANGRARRPKSKQRA